MIQINSKPDLNKLTTDATAFRSMAQLLEAIGTGYFPTLCRGNAAQLQLGRQLEAQAVRIFWIGEARHAA